MIKQFLLLLVCLSLAPFAVALDLTKTMSFDIPAQPLASALIRFAQTTDLQVVTAGQRVDGIRSPGIAGEHSLAEALRALLEGTGFKYRVVGDGTVTIVGDSVGENDADVAAPGAQQHAGMVAPQDALEEIIVTATKREESVLTVPFSINAFSADTLERKGVKDIEELARSVPGLVVLPSGENTRSKDFTIRGISTGIGTAATVAVYLDDTPLTIGLNSPDLKLFDIDRVEVLKGPQGTLFGSSAMGGAIRYVTPQPAYDSIDGRVKVEAGSIGYGSQNYEAQGAVGAPIGDKLALRASGFYRRDGGYVDLVDDETLSVIDQNVDDVDTYGGRIALGARLREGLEATASILFQSQLAHDFSQFFTGLGATVDNPLTSGNESTFVSLRRFQKNERSGNEARDRFFMPNLSVKANFRGGELTSSSSFVDRDVRIDHDFSHFFEGFFVNGFGIPEGALSRSIVANDKLDMDFTGWVQELRLASTGVGPFDWLAGAYYRKTKSEDFRDIESPSAALLLGAPADAELLQVRGVQKTTQLAGFGEASYTFAERLKATAGLRLTHLKVRLRNDDLGLFTDPSAPKFDERSTEKPVTPKFSASYHLTEDAMLYVTAAKGFREGGPNSVLPDFCEAEAAGAGYPDGAPSSFRSDGLWSYEGGAKFKALENRLRFQGAVYRIDWKDIQGTVTLPNCGSSFTDNLGVARVEGFELEANLRAGEHVLLDLAAGHTKGEIKSGVNQGDSLAGVPDYTVNVAAEYDFRLSSDWAGYVRGELTHVGELVDFAGVNRKGYNLTSARAAFTKGSYEFALLVDNVFGVQPIITESSFAFAPWAARGRTTLRPRTIGVSLATRF